MKIRRFSLVLHSFQDLKILKENLPASFPLSRQKKITLQNYLSPDPGTEQELFRKAMADVKPLPHNNYYPKRVRVTLPTHLIHNQEAETIAHLNKLIEKGEGFVVAHTPEYIEGIGYNVKSETAKRLHQGDFAIETYLDLHGYRVQEAKKIFDNFLKAAIRAGQRGILIIHGRGLSSPQEPVLKTQIINWLTRGPWRKWVLAYASARLCDGGSGATYVLLRERSYRIRKEINKASTG